MSVDCGMPLSTEKGKENVQKKGKCIWFTVVLDKSWLTLISIYKNA